MPRRKILAEIKPGGTVRPSILELASKGGSYIIVSSKGSVSDSALAARKRAMLDAIADISTYGNLHLDFYDRERIASWVGEQYSKHSVRCETYRPLYPSKPNITFVARPVCFG